MKKLLLVLMFSIFALNIYAQGKVTESIVNNGDQYLNITNFKNAFKSNVGSMTGNTVYVVVNDCYNDGKECGGHGYQMADIINIIKVSDDVKVFVRSNSDQSIKCTKESKISREKCQLDSKVESLLRKNNIRVWNESNGWPIQSNIKLNMDRASETEQFKKLVKKYDVMYVVSAGNNENEFSTRNVKTLSNNPFDNLLTVAQFGINRENGKPIMENGEFFRAPDFSVFGEYEVAEGEKMSGWAGTSPAAAVTSAIIAQYYSIMPCWSTMDMKRFIYATLKPAKDIELKDIWTKTKEYLSYSEKIFDKNFLIKNNLKLCKQ